MCLLAVKASQPGVYQAALREGPLSGLVLHVYETVMMYESMLLCRVMAL